MFTRSAVQDLPEVARKITNEIKAEWASIPPLVKQCIKQRVGEKMGAQLNQCLASKNVLNFNVTEFLSQQDNVDNPLESLVTEISDGTNGTQMSPEMKKLFTAMINTVRSVRLCNESAGDASASKVDQCIKSRCSSMKKDYCQGVIACAGSEKSDCQTRGEAIYTALCQCKAESIRKLVDILDSVRTQKNLTLADLIKAVSQGQDISGYLTAIRQCYQDNNEKVPQMIAIATTYTNNMSQQSDGNGNGLKHDVIVDPAILNTIRDFLALQCDDEECKVC